MTKELKVIEPFGIMEEDDILILSDNGEYVYTESEEISDSKDNSVFASYSSSYSISKEYAEVLIKEGYLEEVSETHMDKPFVNIFDEIDELLKQYTDELNEADTQNLPAALKVERTTVLTNMIKLLTHLKSLKK